MTTTALAHHDHVFLGAGHHRNERRTMIVVGITAAMMVIEIVAGSVFGSMALLADGWHMSTHAGALLIAAVAYRYARLHAHDPRFTFGTGRIGDLAAFASAAVLAVVAVLIAYDAVWRLIEPTTIHFGEALVVAVVGLGVNLVSAWLLHEGDPAHAHEHGHQHHHHHDDHGHAHHDDDHHHGHGHAHARDNNLRAAYLHVLADAATSVLAIGALALGLLYGWAWLDPAIGLVGAGVIASWALTLMRDAGAVLVDVVPDDGLAKAIRTRIERKGGEIADLHLWQVGPGHLAAALTVVADTPLAAADYRTTLSGLHRLSHVTIEVQAR